MTETDSDITRSYRGYRDYRDYRDYNERYNAGTRDYDSITKGIGDEEKL